MSVRPPETVVVQLGDRRVPLRWTNRAVFRVDASPTRTALEDVREGRGFAFLCVHLWAMLADEADRRRWPTPESLADIIKIDDIAHLKALWRVVWLQAFDFDPDVPAPPAAEVVAGAVAPADGGEPPPSTGPST